MNTLQNAKDREAIAVRMSRLSPTTTGRWGSMSVHQMVCHLNDSYKVALGQKVAGIASSPLPRPIMKFLALQVPMRWPTGVPTLPEVAQGHGKGGSPPVEFGQDLASLQETLEKFCTGMSTSPRDHPIFGKMKVKDWMRWGYLHADHHLRQFGQ